MKKIENKKYKHLLISFIIRIISFHSVFLQKNTVFIHFSQFVGFRRSSWCYVIVAKKSSVFVRLHRISWGYVIALEISSVLVIFSWDFINFYKTTNYHDFYWFSWTYVNVWRNIIIFTMWFTVTSAMVFNPFIIILV